MFNNNRNVVMIDDNQDDYEILTRGFKSVGFDQDITWFKKAKDAIDYFELLIKESNTPFLPKIIILDLNMPGLDGRNMLTLIKSNKKLKSIPTIILSTSGDPQDREFCYENGANTYFQKPLRYQKLQEICKSIKNYWSLATII
jgi:DNA-binding response OmpR family regulator